MANWFLKYPTETLLEELCLNWIEDVLFAGQLFEVSLYNVGYTHTCTHTCLDGYADYSIRTILGGYVEE